MSTNKWKTLKEQSTNSEKSQVSSLTSAQQAYTEAFKAGFIRHLRGETPNNLDNQPRKLLLDAPSEIGKLSRIFDAFILPIPDYPQLPINDPQALRNHLQSNLDALLPVLLNAERTKLNETVIAAIGQEEYNNIVGTGGEQREHEIALQFVQATLVSYGQRILENITDDKIKIEAFSNFLPQVEKNAKEVTLQGLPVITTTKSIPKLKQAIDFFYDAMKQAEDFHIQRARNINGSLIGALDWINPDNEDVSLMPDDVKYDKAIESYHKAVAFFMEEMQETTREQLPDGTKPNSMDELQKRLTYFQKIITQAEEKGIHIADIEHVKELCATASDLIARSSKDEDLSFDNAQYDELIKHYNDLVISLMKGIQEAPQPPPLATAGDKKDIKELQAAVASFQNIVQQSEKETSILIPGIENVKNALVTAMAWINSPDDIEMKYDNALERYQAATTLLVEGIEQCLTNGPPKPQEANFFIKFLRFITRNEKLLQTADEKRYESQLSILPKIDQLAEKMGFIKPSTNTGLIEPVENNEDTQGITRGLS